MKKNSPEYYRLMNDLDQRYEKRKLGPNEPPHRPFPNNYSWEDVERDDLKLFTTQVLLVIACFVAVVLFVVLIGTIVT